MICGLSAAPLLTGSTLLDLSVDPRTWLRRTPAAGRQARNEELVQKAAAVSEEDMNAIRAECEARLGAAERKVRALATQYPRFTVRVSIILFRLKLLTASWLRM